MTQLDWNHVATDIGQLDEIGSLVLGAQQLRRNSSGPVLRYSNQLRSGGVPDWQVNSLPIGDDQHSNTSIQMKKDGLEK